MEGTAAEMLQVGVGKLGMPEEAVEGGSIEEDGAEEERRGRLERDAGGGALDAEPGERGSHHVHGMCLVMLMLSNARLRCKRAGMLEMTLFVLERSAIIIGRRNREYR